MRLRSALILPVICLFPFLLQAQVSFTTITDESAIRLNGIIQVQYVVENAGKIESFQPPVFHDFKIMQGPMETSGMSILNNQLSAYKALTFVLQPLRKGRLTVPGASAVVDGKKILSNKVTIEVSDAAPVPTNPYPRNPGISSLQESAEEDFLLGEQENAGDKIKKNLLVKLELDKTTAYIGQPIVATYKLYTRLRSESRVSKRPSMNGFSVYDMVEPYGGGPVVEKLNGRPFMVHTIRKTQLIPLQEGLFVLDPVELENSVRFLRSSNKTAVPPSRSPIEKMFDDLLAPPSGEWEEHHITLSSQPREVIIKPLPEGAPISFNGAVGQFSMQGQLKDSTVMAGENASYELKIEGSGNLPLLNAPAWQLPQGFNNFEPSVTEEINKTVAPMQGSKTFSYTFTIGKSGIFTLPPLAFSYFDPGTKSYKLLQTKAVNLRVLAGTNQASSGKVPVTEVKENYKPSPWLLAIAITLAGCSLALWLFLRKKKQQATIEVETIESPALVMRPDPFFAAKQAAIAGSSVDFYKSLETGLWMVVAGKLGLPVSDQQKPWAAEYLAKRGLSTADIQSLKDCWKKCEWALYVPNAVLPVEEGLLQKAEELVDAIESLP